MTIPSAIMAGIVFDTDISQLNGTGAFFTLLLLASYYWDRIICLNQCLKEHVNKDDVTRAKRYFLIVSLWAAIAFLGGGSILKLNYDICLCIYGLVGDCSRSTVDHSLPKSKIHPKNAPTFLAYYQKNLHTNKIIACSLGYTHEQAIFILYR